MWCGGGGVGEAPLTPRSTVMLGVAGFITVELMCFEFATRFKSVVLGGFLFFEFALLNFQINGTLFFEFESLLAAQLA